MNPIVDIIFTVTWVVLLVYAVRMMALGWQTNDKPVVHPEMKDVRSGEELMGVTFKSKEVTECSLEEYKDLQARIDELRMELEGDDEDDDDDGDVVALRR